MTSVLNTLYVSGGNRIIYSTLQIRNSVESFFLVEAYVPLTARLETGEMVTFNACSMKIALPARNSDGTQDIKFAISNIDGTVSAAIRRALSSSDETTVTYREYVSGDLEAPSTRPYEMVVKDGEWTALQADIRAGYMNILDTAWPRDLYTPNEYPGIRFIS